MSELLTTGQMIDRLKVGEVAESEKGTKVKKNEYGDLTHYERQVLDNRGFVLQKDFLDFKWRILPNYVSFEEAMKAHKDKKTVTYHHGEELKYRFEHNYEPDQFEKLNFDSICLHELIDGKWTIEGESNES